MLGLLVTARLGVGLQGLAVGETAYQNAVQYAHDRRQGRALPGPAEPLKLTTSDAPQHSQTRTSDFPPINFQEPNGIALRNALRPRNSRPPDRTARN